MKLLLFLLLIIYLISSCFSIAPSSYQQHNMFNDIWSSCGKSNDHFKISEVSISPDPPVKGKPVTITASGVLDENIQSGKVKVIVKFGIMVIFNHEEDLCGSFNPQGCPLPAGPYNRTVTTPVIPHEVPSGKYQGSVVVVDQNEQEVACVNVSFSLS